MQTSRGLLGSTAHSVTAESLEKLVHKQKELSHDPLNKDLTKVK